SPRAPRPPASPLALHDALPISDTCHRGACHARPDPRAVQNGASGAKLGGRRSRSDWTPSRTSGPAKPMNSSAREVSKLGPARRRSEEHTSELHHVKISYAVFCL